MSLTEMANLINVSKSTVSREIKRNSNMHRHYVAIDAQQFSDMRKSVPRRPRKLSKEDCLDIEQCLKRHWSPETIAGVRKRDGKTCVSIEWMYHIIRRDKERGGTFYSYLPHHLKHRRRPVGARIPHQGPREHRRETRHSGCESPVRRLGDGHHHRQGRQGSHCHPR